MTSSSKPRSRSDSTLGRIVFVFSVLFLALLIGTFVAGAAALRSLKASTSVQDLHHELLASLNIPNVSSVEVSIPGWIATLARVGAWLADVDPEIRAALQAVGRGQVGVYELEKRPTRESWLAMLDAADQRLGTGEWTRVVTVLEDEEFVAVYALLPSTPRNGAVDLVVLALDGRDLVMVSARAYPKPLMELASSTLADLEVEELMK